MAGETDKNVDEKSAIEEKPKDETNSKEKEKEKNKKKQKGVLARMWNGLFGSRKDDFEQRLEKISKEEKIIIIRMRKRAQNWGTIKRNIILFSVVMELVAVGYAIMTARTAENWKDRAQRVLPMFLLPVLSTMVYSGLSSVNAMCERKDQKTLEKLQTERQNKIDELKERTNFYLTQQLIQRYDTDPAAKAAAAAVLASKFTEGTGLKLSLQGEHEAEAGKGRDVEMVQSTGLRNRRQPQGRATSPGGTMIQHSAETSPQGGSEYDQHNQPRFVDHFQGEEAASYNSGWLSRVAALLVREDPTQCYALICGNCRMHNGLASKEDFPYVTYICPHCHAVNGPKIHASTTGTPNMGSAVSVDPSHTTSGVVDSPHENMVDNAIAEVAPTPAPAKVSNKTELRAEGD